MFSNWYFLMKLGWLLWLSSRNWLFWCWSICDSWGISCLSQSSLDESRGSCGCESWKPLNSAYCLKRFQIKAPRYECYISFLLQVVQLLETPFVNLINYASLVTTNAARHRFVAGKSKLLLEFGLRRAQVL